MTAATRIFVNNIFDSIYLFERFAAAWATLDSV